MKLLPMEKVTGSKDPKAVVFQMPQNERGESVKVTEGTKRPTLMHIYIMSSRSIASDHKIKREVLMLLKYNMQSLDEVQLGWLFGKSSFAVSAEGTKRWIELLLGQEKASGFPGQESRNQILSIWH